jgi:acetylornithine deacetylase/succinyl-diaminopimelate desuccinylase-like protein
MMTIARWGFAGLATMAAAPLMAQTPALRPDQVRFRALYQEMVETDTSITSGSCTALADKIEGHLKTAGYTAEQITRFSVPDHLKEGGLVVILPGTSKTLKPMLLLGHLDVVVAKREDWQRDPYKMVEENGYFYGRGTSDMKAMDAIWLDAMMRFKEQGYKPKRTIKLAFTCGEETSWAFNGTQWLAKNKPDLIAAEFALNEGGGGRSDGHGKIAVANMHVGEKNAVNYRIEATNPGGHSSAPVRENAIYELADAIAKVRDYDFPLMLNDTTKAYFSKAGAARGGDELGKAMIAIAANPQDKTAEAILNRDKGYHSMLRTTCVATLLDGGHANNALPQRAGANINCRIFPGVSPDEVRQTLIKVIADPKMTVSKAETRGPVAAPPPLDPKITGPAEKLVSKYYPGVPLIPTMSTGATDGIFLEAIGIPSYGPPGTYGDPDGNGSHGLNERAIVKAVYTGRDLLTELVKVYADGSK